MIPKPEPLTTEGQSEDPNKNNTRAKCRWQKRSGIYGLGDLRSRRWESEVLRENLFFVK